MQLQVEVSEAGIVGKGQAAQHALDPHGRLVGRRARVVGQPFVERHAGTPVDGDERPMLVNAALQWPHDVGVVEPGGAAHRQQPRRSASRRGRRDAWHRQHGFAAGTRVEGEPEHGRLALGDQATQLEAAEGARRCRRNGNVNGSGGRHREGMTEFRDWNANPAGKFTDVPPIRPASLPHFTLSRPRRRAPPR